MNDSPPVFVDTSFFKALIDDKDGFHLQAIKILEILKKKERNFITSNFILDESFTVIRIKCGLKLTLEFRRYLEESSMVLKIVRVTVADEAEAWKWFLKDWSKLSFTDCVSFAVMERLNLEHVAAFDEHFQKAGFKVVTEKSS